MGYYSYYYYICCCYCRLPPYFIILILINALCQNGVIKLEPFFIRRIIFEIFYSQYFIFIVSVFSISACVFGDCSVLDTRAPAGPARGCFPMRKEIGSRCFHLAQIVAAGGRLGTLNPLGRGGGGSGTSAVVALDYQCLSWWQSSWGDSSRSLCLAGPVSPTEH